MLIGDYFAFFRALFYGRRRMETKVAMIGIIVEKTDSVE